MYICQNSQNILVFHVELTCISAVRTVKAGHKLVAEGSELFKDVVSNAGAGDLPQLLRSTKTTTTPQLATPPPKLDGSTATPSPSPVKKEEGTGKELEWIRVVGKVQYSCP